MSIILLLLGVHMIASMQFSKAGEFNTDYIGRSDSGAVKGVFVALIFMSHFTQYITEGPYDAAYRLFQNHMNQMVVSMFWFYSGYGILESLRRKGRAYVVHFPVRRLLTVWIDFALVVCVYLAMYVADGKTLSPLQIVYAVTGWKSFGNSNWFIFATLVLYICFFLAFIWIRDTADTRQIAAGLVLFTLLSVAFVYVEMKLGQPKYCYNTVILFALGGWYSLVRKAVEKVVMRNEILYFGTVLCVVGVYLLSYQRRWKYGIEGYTVWAVAFTVLIVLFTMKCSLRSNLLEWLGAYTFGVYVLQRIPMNLLSKYGYMETHKYSCFVLSLAATLLLAVGFRHFTDWLNARVIRCFERGKTNG